MYKQYDVHINALSKRFAGVSAFECSPGYRVEYNKPQTILYTISVALNGILMILFRERGVDKKKKKEK